MSHRDAVRKLARRMPRRLRELRGKLMLESQCAYLGVEEVECPACGGDGWLDRRGLEYCPICCGFREVPDSLADWFRARMESLNAAEQGRRERTPVEVLAREL
jgi:hypothetical protein